MPAQTPDGWPYVEGPDLPVQYPVTSQALAELLEARWDTYESAGLLVATAPWAVSGQCVCTKSGGMVTVEGVLMHTTGITLAPGTTYTMGTVPAGFRPIIDRATSAAIYTGSQYGAPCTFETRQSGQLRVYVSTSTVLAPNAGCVLFTQTYRQGG